MEDHLLLLLKDECQYGWETIREYHGAWLEAIEQGAASWDDHSAREELRCTFIWAPVATKSTRAAAASAKPASKPTSAPAAKVTLLPCKEFNKGSALRRRIMAL